MDVTQEILRNTQIYGSSDYTASHSLASSKSLNYAEGASIQRPINEQVSSIPFRLNFKDTVGLFGAENVFIKINLTIQDTANRCIEEEGWQCLRIEQFDDPLLNGYYEAEADVTQDLETVNSYEPAIISNPIPGYGLPYVGVTLTNFKTGNKYIDAWFDCRLYTKSKEEHPYDEMYLPINDYFYIGFHARNTKRLPYNVECLVGSGIKTKNEVDPKLIAKV